LVIAGVGQENGNCPMLLRGCAKGGIAVAPGYGLDTFTADRAALRYRARTNARDNEPRA
jgi:hypothetical protein